MVHQTSAEAENERQRDQRKTQRKKIKKETLHPDLSIHLYRLQLQAQISERRRLRRGKALQKISCRCLTNRPREHSIKTQIHSCFHSFSFIQVWKNQTRRMNRCVKSRSWLRWWWSDRASWGCCWCCWCVDRGDDVSTAVKITPFYLLSV